MPTQPAATPNDILLYIYENGPVRSRDLERVFIQPKRMSRGTMYKYKRQLETQGKIERNAVLDRPPYYTFSVPKRHHQEVKLLQQYKILTNNTFLNIDEANKRFVGCGHSSSCMNFFDLSIYY